MWGREGVTFRARKSLIPQQGRDEREYKGVVMLLGLQISGTRKHNCRRILLMPPEQLLMDAFTLTCFP